MSKKQKRWRVSDIVGAALGGAEGAYVASTMRESSSLADGMRRLGLTLPMACGVDEFSWQRMTHKQRCDALVATARRLNVPMNG